MPVSESLYEQVSLADPDHKWELYCGELVRKPAMTQEHDHVFRRLGMLFSRQLDPDEYEVATDSARLRISTGSFFVPDVCVIPVDSVRPRLTRSPRLAVFEEPMPLVVEVWSPSTGEYDVDTKFPEYRRRGDREIWRLHPFERTLTVWRQQPDGSYLEAIQRGGTVRPATLPGVTIDLDALFALIDPQ